MNTDYTYDQYLNDQETLSLGYGEPDDYERCPYCGDHFEEMDEYRGKRMCADCVDIERRSDAEKALAPSYKELFQAV